MLLLLPTDHNKLLLQWRGPFLVTEKVGPVDYRIDIHGKLKVFHANLLKLYIGRSDTQSTERTCTVIPETADEILNIFECASVSVIECETADMPDESLDEPKFDNQILLTPSLHTCETIDDVEINSLLSIKQQQEVKRLLGNFRDVMTDVPGRTNLGHHDIKLTFSDPIRSKPYPTPFALIETVNAEVEDMLKL